jgi:hypothetical protein
MCRTQHLPETCTAPMRHRERKSTAADREFSTLNTEYFKDIVQPKTRGV